MAYCRFGKTYEVFLYGTHAGYVTDKISPKHQVLVCAACRLTSQRRYPFWEQGIFVPGKFYWWWQNKIFKTRSGALKHLQDHAQAGHRFPKHAYDRLEAEKYVYGNSVERPAWDESDE
jgi:hypothetical protein